jgi:hypothetical protein
MATIDRAVSDGEAHTRNELGAALAADGIEVDRLALTYMVMYAELEALICSGPRRGKQQTYMSVDARVPSAPELTARTVTVTATLFTEPDSAGGAAVETEVARFGRFLGRSAAWTTNLQLS